MIILGIETSCDETAISVIEASGDFGNLSFKLLGSSINSQVKIHEQYGGVFPTLAKREHIKNLPVVYKQAIEESKVKESDIDKIAVTVGPGLEPALWTGINFAKQKALELGKEIIPTNHMIGHMASVLLQSDKQNLVQFPAIALLISGGHTELVLLKSWLEKIKIGETLDDAVGEAFDKVARMLGLPYPGGPQISKLAIEAREENNAEKTIKLPRPMIHSDNLDFSFSGLKTAVLYYLRDHPEIRKKEMAREFEDSVIEILIHKTRKAIDKYSPRTLIIGGGVIANQTLREQFNKLKESYHQIKILIPEKGLTTDNATMIAIAGYLEYLAGKTYKKLEADGNLSFEN